MSGGVKKKSGYSVNRVPNHTGLEQGIKPADLSRRHGIPENTISRWNRDATKQMFEKYVCAIFRQFDQLLIVCLSGVIFYHYNI